METQRLTAIQVPDRTLALLESFATIVLRMPVGAYRLEHIDELPQNMRRHVGIGPDKHYVWFAWSGGEQISLITGALALERSRERGRPVLEIRSYDVNGLLDEAAMWVRTSADQWARCAW
jgi:hypothetical protein